VTTTVQTANQNCPAWCLRHEPAVEGLCIGPAVELGFGPNPDNPQHARDARILTYNEPGGIITLSLIVNGTESFDMTPAQARQIAAALNQAADATEDGAR